MKKLDKALKKLNHNEQILALKLIDQIIAGNFFSLNTKKLKGYDNTFRVRKGTLRIVYATRDDKTTIISLGRRSETTYHR